MKFDRIVLYVHTHQLTESVLFDVIISK